MTTLIKSALVAVVLAASLGTVSANTSNAKEFSMRFFQELNARSGG
ncbi:MAG: hypothetical protein ACK4MF_09800 [Hyphomicrobiaceae bacterium]